MGQLNIDLSGAKVQGDGQFDLLPTGNYNVTCDEAEIKDTKAGTGKYIKVTFRIRDGEFKDRKVWHNFNIENPNPTAVEIGMSQLKSFLTYSEAKTPETFTGVEQLYGLYCGAFIMTKKSTDPQYADQNEIKTFKSPLKKSQTKRTISEEDVPF